MLLYLSISSAAYAQSTGDILINRQAADNHRALREYSQSRMNSPSNPDRLDDMFGNAFGQLFGKWLAGKARRQPESVWVRDVPGCFAEFQATPRRYTLVGHPMQGKTEMPPSDRWIILYRKNDAGDAVAAACWLGSIFPTPQVFATSSGDYVIVAGTVLARQAERVLRDNKANGTFPPEAFVSRGSELRDRLWAAPDVMLTEKRQLRQ